MGPEKRSSMLAEGELEIVAYHEAGHVLTAELCPNHEKAQRATVRPRGRAAGLALYGRMDRSLQDAAFVHEQMVCALGGRAAEQIVFGTVSSGAANDLSVVNGVARRAIEELGFSPRLGQIVRTAHGHALPLSQETLALIDREVERVVADAYRDALALLARHRASLDALAQLLLTQGDVERVDIVTALGRKLDAAELSPVMGTREMHPQERPASAQRVVVPFRSKRRGIVQRLASAVVGEPMVPPRAPSSALAETRRSWPLAGASPASAATRSCPRRGGRVPRVPLSVGGGGRGVAPRSAACRGFGCRGGAGSRERFRRRLAASPRRAPTSPLRS
jgi:cell division protease FtsH